MSSENTGSSRIESISFYLLLATVVLAPIAFWPSQYFAIEATKTFVIGLLTMLSVICVTICALKARQVKLPPRSIVTIGTLMAASIIASAISSGHFMKSFFGQGFEVGTGSFLIALLVAGLVTAILTARRADRVIVLYVGIFAVYILTWVIQVVKLLGGDSFLTLGILSNATSTLVGNWFSFGIFSAIVAVMSLSAVQILRLSTKMKVSYWVIFAISALALLVVNSSEILEMVALVFIGLTIYGTSQNSRPEGGRMNAFFRRLSWKPLIAAVVALILAWQGVAIVGPIVSKINAGYSELSLPWRLTMDVAAGELKAHPLFGAGPNRFSQSFLAYKPVSINTTDAWGVEFNTGFALIPTYVVTQGAVGGILWALFLIFFGMLGVKSLRGLLRAGGSGESIPEAERTYARFVIVSSYAAAALIWLVALVYVPVHAALFMGFLMTGIWLGASVAYGRLRALEIVSRQGSLSYSVVPVVQVIILIVAVLWGFTFLKNTIALAYFGSGVKSLTAKADPVAADAKFSTALWLNPLDVYWQAKSEASISLANKTLTMITATSTTEESTKIVTDAGTMVNDAMKYTNNAITSDPDNYNNYISQARVAELGTVMKMTGSYDTAVKAYTAAIQRNPGNPSLYLSLARLQASQSQLDPAIQTIGAALQVKQNYLDAVYALSQIEAAKGNLNDAATAAAFAVQLNPQNALLHFQLGLLEYNRGNYTSAATAFENAVKLQTNYANAQYFLGLSYARLNKNSEAIGIFEQLAVANPDNSDLASILSALRAGKSIFAPQSPTATAARPEKKSTPPIKER